MVERAYRRWVAVAASVATAALVAATPALVRAAPRGDDSATPVRTLAPANSTVAAPTTSIPASSLPTITLSIPSIPATTTPGASTTTTTTTTVADPSVTVLTDTTGRITVAVPKTWVDTDVRPTIRDDGGRRPTITASPDLTGWTSGWAVPGMFLVALPPTANPRTLLDAYTFTGTCEDEGVEAFSGGDFTGLSQVWSHCGGGETQLQHISARSSDNTYAIFLQIQTTADDRDALDTIVESVAAVPGANPGETSPIARPAETLGDVAADLTIGEPSGDVVQVQDETARLSVAVPADWTDLNNAAGSNDDFSVRPRLVAATDVTEFAQDWTVPGVEFTAFPYRPDPYTIIDNRGWSTGCDDGGLESLDVRGYTGVMQTWTNCGDTATRLIAIAVAPPDQSVTLYLEVQLPNGDDDPLRTVLASFDYV